MPDLTAIIQNSATTAWLYIPVAVVLGALHALEPGHAKSLMAAYIVAIRGTVAQAALLAISAAAGHTIVVWALAITAFAFGRNHIVEEAEPWLMLISGILVVLLAIRMFLILRQQHEHSHHGHAHQHDHSHAHAHQHGHSHAPPPGVKSATAGQIVWFGFTGGLVPCPAAVAVLLVCVQLKAFALGIAMVAAFSAGLALTLVAIGVGVAWGAGKASARWPGFERLAQRLPYLSAGIVGLLGIVMTAAGINATGLVGPRKPG